MRPSIPATNEIYPGLLRDAFAVLDHYGVRIANRDPSRSLDEDGCDLLRRVRQAMDPLLAEEALKDPAVAQLAQQIDGLLATECPIVQNTAPRMGAGR